MPSTREDSELVILGDFKRVLKGVRYGSGVFHSCTFAPGSVARRISVRRIGFRIGEGEVAIHTGSGVDLEILERLDLDVDVADDAVTVRC